MKLLAGGKLPKFYFLLALLMLVLLPLLTFLLPLLSELKPFDINEGGVGFFTHTSNYTHTYTYLHICISMGS